MLLEARQVDRRRGGLREGSPVQCGVSTSALLNGTSFLCRLWWLVCFGCCLGSRPVRSAAGRGHGPLTGNHHRGQRGRRRGDGCRWRRGGDERQALTRFAPFPPVRSARAQRGSAAPSAATPRSRRGPWRRARRGRGCCAGPGPSEASRPSAGLPAPGSRHSGLAATASLARGGARLLIELTGSGHVESGSRLSSGAQGSQRWCGRKRDLRREGSGGSPAAHRRGRALSDLPPAGVVAAPCTALSRATRARAAISCRRVWPGGPSARAAVGEEQCAHFGAWQSRAVSCSAPVGARHAHGAAPSSLGAQGRPS
jgi:hypothetical protein